MFLLNFNSILYFPPFSLSLTHTHRLLPFPSTFPSPKLAPASEACLCIYVMETEDNISVWSRATGIRSTGPPPPRQPLGIITRVPCLGSRFQTRRAGGRASVPNRRNRLAFPSPPDAPLRYERSQLADASAGAKLPELGSRPTSPQRGSVGGVWRGGAVSAVNCGRTMEGGRSNSRARQLEIRGW